MTLSQEIIQESKGVSKELAPCLLDKGGAWEYNKVASDNLSDLLIVLEINLEEGKCMSCRREIHGIW